MKTTLRILIIFAITALVAGGIYLLVENTSIVRNLSAGPEDRRTEFAEGERAGRPEGGERSEGNHRHNQSASLSGGLAEMGTSLVKIGVITVIVLAIQFIFARFQKRKPAAKLAA